MKAIYLVQYFYPERASGLQLVSDLLEGFAQKGWEVNLYTPTPTRGVADKQRKEYCKKRKEMRFDNKLIIHRMHLYSEGKSIASRALRYVIFSVECFWKCVTVPADFIFTGSGPPTQGLVVGLAKKFCKNKKIIYNLQDIFPDSLLTSNICTESSSLMKIGRKIENFTYRNADVIITVSEDMKENIIKKGVPEEKVEVVRNWIDTNKITPISPKANSLYRELGLSSDKFYVLYAGNIGKVQGMEVVVDAAELLKNNEDIRFMIFGNGSEEKNIKEQIADKKITNISLYPLQPEERISEVYSLGDVSIVSCRAGTGGSGTPSKTWTIMATGTAILASFDCNGEMDRTLRDAKCGYCVEPGNAEALADAILSLSNHRDTARQMGINARRYAEKSIAKEQAVEKYTRIIEDVLTRK
jgi:glycosyltransferase involved in cell wall biosynthesis